MMCVRRESCRDGKENGRQTQLSRKKLHRDFHIDKSSNATSHGKSIALGIHIYFNNMPMELQISGEVFIVP